MRRRLLLTNILVLLLLVLNACSSSDNAATEMNETEISETEKTSSEMVTSQNSTDSSDTISVEIGYPKHEKYEVKKFDSISDMIRQSDTYYTEHFNTNETNWVDKDLYEKALEAYDREIGTLTAECICEMNYSSEDRLRFSFGYIDNDSIPEVFVCGNDTGICGVHIFMYDSKEDKVVWIGEYGTRGVLRYAEGKGRIIAQYGNGGFFTDNYIKVSPYIDPEIVGRTAWYYSEGGEICYARLPFPEDSDGSNNSPRQSNKGGIPLDEEDDFSAHNTNYVVGSDEYKSIITVLLNFAPQEAIKEVYIDEMDIVTLGEGGMELPWSE